MTQVFGAVGQCVLAGVIYFIRDWRLAQLITAAPLAVVAVYIWCACTLVIALYCFKGKLCNTDLLSLFLSGLFQSQPGGC